MQVSFSRCLSDNSHTCLRMSITRKCAGTRLCQLTQRAHAVSQFGWINRTREHNAIQAEDSGNELEIPPFRGPINSQDSRLSADMHAARKKTKKTVASLTSDHLLSTLLPKLQQHIVHAAFSFSLAHVVVFHRRAFVPWEKIPSSRNW